MRVVSVTLFYSSEPVSDVRKQQRIAERVNEVNAKYQKTVESSVANGAESTQNKKVRNADGLRGKSVGIFYIKRCIVVMWEESVCDCSEFLNSDE